MPRLLPLLLASAAVSLAACDQVRLPGSGEATPASPPETTPTDTASVDTPPVTDVAAPEPKDEAPVTEVETGETITTEPPEIETDTGAEPADTDAPEAEAGITDLAAINAAICGLPLRPLDNSLTLAEQTGAQPADPDVIDTATINGVAASLADFPGLVKMEPREILPGGAISSGHCGATRIAQNWFITAAHCLDDDYDEVLLIAGVENLQNPTAERVQARASVCHAAYGGAGNNFVNDIALVRVDDTVLPDLAGVPIATFGEADKPLVPFNYSNVKMAGWGLTSFNGRLSSDLLTATLALTGTGPAAIGVESVDGAGPCVGDSGGPLFVADEDGTQTVVGVLSVVEQNQENGLFCDGTYGARYTNLQGYQDWIAAVIETCDNTSGLCGF